ncbi:MAG TPA: ATP-dependent DNA helicase RecG [Candidatus Nanoarchaeia archaeon]|nr:ATP-dependent DNA helicase RecG [Candidatus Nanoarchaeia archaeon]
MIELQQPVTRLKGVGVSVELRLARLGITTVEDLIGHYPRRYEDFSKITPIRLMKPGPVTLRGQVQQIASRRARSRRLSITEAIISDDTGTVKAVWFNQPYLAKSLATGTEVFVSGRLEFRNNDLALQAPSIESVNAETKNTARIVPVYPETEGLSSKQLRGLILPLLANIEQLPETLPEEIIAGYKLVSRAEAMSEIHFPSSTVKLSRARHRLAFEELFFLILASQVIKQEIKTEKAPRIKLDVAVVKRLLAQLQFQLTDAQRKAAWQILQDLESDQPMNRLLEGDVGSGKTVVAMISAAVANASGHQVALMVPTDILARQHHDKIAPIMAELGFRTGILLGSQPVATKRPVLQDLAEGNIDLLIGTHALLSGPVKFNKLGLVIIDEQHRFGVQQRQVLKQKAGRLPHLLSMTATPIPRSLALTVYGDLDISIIDSLPPGRQKITTRVTRDKERDEVYSFIDQQIGEGQQVFVVCPLINESDKTGSKSVLAEAERLQKTVFKHRRIGLLHGKLKSDEKEDVMVRFARRDIDILVSTNVIEVGIDIPNATIMMIEGADHFGLAALHQMRGRVGRGTQASYCFLLYDNLSTGAAERLAAMEKTADGFRLAQIDLEMRGPGQIYGIRQHGVLELELADIGDTKLVAAVREAVASFATKPSAMLKYPHIKERVNALKAVTSLD